MADKKKSSLSDDFDAALESVRSAGEDVKAKVWEVIRSAAPHSVTDIKARNDAAEDYANSARDSHKRRDNETR